MHFSVSASTYLCTYAVRNAREKCPQSWQDTAWTWKWYGIVASPTQPKNDIPCSQDRVSAARASSLPCISCALRKEWLIAINASFSCRLWMMMMVVTLSSSCLGQFYPLVLFRSLPRCAFSLLLPSPPRRGWRLRARGPCRFQWSGSCEQTVVKLTVVELFPNFVTKLSLNEPNVIFKRRNYLVVCNWVSSLAAVEGYKVGLEVGREGSANVPPSVELS